MSQLNIKIRKTELSDAKALQELYQAKNTYSNTLQLPHPSIEMWTKRFTSIPENVHTYVAIVKNEQKEDEIVGHLGFEVMSNVRRRHVGSFGMGVKDTYQGKGIGSTLMQTMIDLADNWFNIQRIELTVFTDNEPAIALYKKFGFIIEGEAINYAYRNGEYVNAYYMSRIKT